MCSHYEAPTAKQLALAFGIKGEEGIFDLWPGYVGPFLRRSGNQDCTGGTNHQVELLRGSFGLPV